MEERRRAAGGRVSAEVCDQPTVSVVSGSGREGESAPFSVAIAVTVPPLGVLYDQTLRSLPTLALLSPLPVTRLAFLPPTSMPPATLVVYVVLVVSKCAVPASTVSILVAFLVAVSPPTGRGLALWLLFVVIVAVSS